MRLFLALLILTIANNDSLFAQENESSPRVIQFSGVITVEEGGQIIPLPFATIGVVGTARGTYTEFDGFFSLVVEVGDTVEMRSLGFETEHLVIPDDADTFYSVLRTLKPASINLPLIDIMPIPSREFFKEEFLAMDVTSPLAERARRNLAEGLLSEIRKNLPSDGRETGAIYQQQVLQNYVYSGQFKPQNILNPIAWKKFIDAWKRGDFKNKKKK